MSKRVTLYEGKAHLQHDKRKGMKTKKGCLVYIIFRLIQTTLHYVLECAAPFCCLNIPIGKVLDETHKERKIECLNLPFCVALFVIAYCRHQKQTQLNVSNVQELSLSNHIYVHLYCRFLLFYTL